MQVTLWIEFAQKAVRKILLKTASEPCFFHGEPPAKKSEEEKDEGRSISQTQECLWGKES